MSRIALLSSQVAGYSGKIQGDRARVERSRDYDVRVGGGDCMVSHSPQV